MYVLFILIIHKYMFIDLPEGEVTLPNYSRILEKFIKKNLNLNTII